MQSLEGVDYSWARPGGGTLKAAGKHFAVRYVPYPGHGGKGLDVNELANLTNNGVDVAMVFESTASRALAGRAAGQADARLAQAGIVGIGLPAGLPIYFAVDFDAAENQQGAIDEYLRGCADIIGFDRVGIYAGYWVVKRCQENGTAKYLWQTYAWSGGNLLNGIHLYQYLNGQDLNGAVDFTRALQENYGQASKFGGSVSNTSEPITIEAEQAAAVANGETYTVRGGDTLSGIAAKYGTTYQVLAKINAIADPNKIYPGQVIKLTGTGGVTATTAAPAAAGGSTYVVVAGDTLSGIAQRYGTNYQTLAAANGIADPNKISVGQIIKIGGGGAAAPAASTYTIKSGDTLGGIAQLNGTTWQRLQQLNGIADANLIYPGQVIRLA